MSAYCLTTIDYGPCAFLDAYDPATVFSSIDEHGRYAYGNQPGIARWNLARLAETLLPLVAHEDDEAAVQQAVAQATAVIDAFPGLYEQALLRGQRAKLGLAGEEPDDRTLAEAWLALLQAQAVDFTLAWRHLADAAEGKDTRLRALFAEPASLETWLARWRERCARDGLASGARAAAMRRVNPWLIPRNHRVEEALAAAMDSDDLAPFERLLAALQRPFDEDPALAQLAEPAPAAQTARYQTFCGT